jgi:hypothetical protein
MQICVIKIKGGFSFFKRKGGKISSGVQTAPLSELWQELGLKTFTQNRRGEAKFWWG